VWVCEGQRRPTPKSPSVPSPAAKPSKAACVETGGRPATKEQMERNVMLQQQREHLQAQLVLQQQLHNELEQHLKLQQEHDELQAQLMVRCYINITGFTCLLSPEKYHRFTLVLESPGKIFFESHAFF